MTMERNEVVVHREETLSDENIEHILESGIKSILLHREDANTNEYSIILNTLQKDPTNSEREAIQYIYYGSAAPRHLTTPAHAR